MPSPPHPDRKAAANSPQAGAVPVSLSGALHNAEIAAAFDEIADILEIENANPFRVRAYRNASRVVTGLPTEAAVMISRGEKLAGLPGIGVDLADKIKDLALSGTTPLLKTLRGEVPPGLPELLRLPGMGPKRVKLIHDALGIRTVDELHRALIAGRLRGLRGFGDKTIRRLIEAIDAQAQLPVRIKRATAMQYAEPLAIHLRAVPGVGQVTIAGSYRRARETVGDIDIVAAAQDPALAIDAFADYPEVTKILAKGPTRATVVLRSGLQVDLRVVAPESYGSALVYFTGSKAHNIAIRGIAHDRGLKISEYGVFRGRRRIAGATESEVYATIGLPEIPPELREDEGEIAAAREDRLPRLVELDDIRGDLHLHTSATDGRNSLDEMVAAAKTRGYQYIAVTEHSRHLTVARGFTASRLTAQMHEIQALNCRRLGIKILTGIEVDILEDGLLDLPDALLAKLDLVVAAVHSKFDLGRAQQTDRILRALDNPVVTLLAHPSGRLIGEREAYDIDIEQVLKKAKAHGCFIELNAQPERLDLFDVHCRMARDLGVLVSINTDAHSTADLGNMSFGIGQARRGWLEKKDVLNTRSAAELGRLLSLRREGKVGRTV
jgi:DNA polymerase (family 10)